MVTVHCNKIRICSLALFSGPSCLHRFHCLISSGRLETDYHPWLWSPGNRPSPLTSVAWQPTITLDFGRLTTDHRPWLWSPGNRPSPLTSVAWQPTITLDLCCLATDHRPWLLSPSKHCGFVEAARTHTSLSAAPTPKLYNRLGQTCYTMFEPPVIKLRFSGVDATRHKEVINLYWCRTNNDSFHNVWILICINARSVKIDWEGVTANRMKPVSGVYLYVLHICTTLRLSVFSFNSVNFTRCHTWLNSIIIIVEMFFWFVTQLTLLSVWLGEARTKVKTQGFDAQNLCERSTVLKFILVSFLNSFEGLITTETAAIEVRNLCLLFSVLLTPPSTDVNYFLCLKQWNMKWDLELKRGWQRAKYIIISSKGLNKVVAGQKSTVLKWILQCGYLTWEAVHPRSGVFSNYCPEQIAHSSQMILLQERSE